ncbi:MAG: hypothetical protein E6I63_04820 [Chloroflexi bacterium]|nr:MAG: hypothetical protein E6I63_04820 [Chloroflexota bacterium]
MPMASDPSSRWHQDPRRLPSIRGDSVLVQAGDRRPGARFCALCATPLEGGAVLRGMWAYCSIECALKIEREDKRL